MTAEIYQLRDFQSKKDRERIAKMAREILDQIDTAPCELSGGTRPIDYGAGIDGMFYESSLGFVAPENDPA